METWNSGPVSEKWLRLSRTSRERKGREPELRESSSAWDSSRWSGYLPFSPRHLPELWGDAWHPFPRTVTSSSNGFPPRAGLAPEGELWSLGHRKGRGDLNPPALLFVSAPLSWERGEWIPLQAPFLGLDLDLAVPFCLAFGSREALPGCCYLKTTGKAPACWCWQ